MGTKRKNVNLELTQREARELLACLVEASTTKELQETSPELGKACQKLIDRICNLVEI